MNHSIVSAVFDSHSEAEAAVRELRQAGVRDTALSIIGRHEGVSGGDYGGADTHEVKEKGDGRIKGAIGGAGVGALLGLAALAIPGAGAGALTGGLSGLLTKHGVSDEDARYYEEHIHGGGVFVSVDTGDGGLDGERARDILYRNGGHSASRARTTAAV